MCVRSFAVIIGFLALVGPSCSNSDNLALLMDTLKPMHKSVCDDQPVFLECPMGTCISILVAQYGDTPPLDQDCKIVVDRSCKLPNRLQYMLLQRVVEACQKKPSCQFSTNPGKDDPCPSSRKFVEVSYKCRPFEYRSLNACNEQVVNLSCNSNSRIAIYDVQYGRNLLDSNTCPQPQGVPEESCSTPYAVETVMRICHGKRRCQFIANRSTFDTFCKPYTKPYVKVIYACVPLGVLTERYETPAGKDDSIVTDQSPYEDNAGEKWRPPPIVDPALESTEETTTYRFPGKTEVIYRPNSTKNNNANNVVPQSLVVLLSWTLIAVSQATW